MNLEKRVNLQDVMFSNIILEYSNVCQSDRVKVPSGNFKYS